MWNFSCLDSLKFMLDEFHPPTFQYEPFHLVVLLRAVLFVLYVPSHLDCRYSRLTAHYTSCYSSGLQRKDCNLSPLSSYSDLPILTGIIHLYSAIPHKISPSIIF